MGFQKIQRFRPMKKPDLNLKIGFETDSNPDLIKNFDPA
jgi:hypothetical protein